MVALQPAGEVVPGGRDHGVFALQVADDLLVCSLQNTMVSWDLL